MSFYEYALEKTAGESNADWPSQTQFALCGALGGALPALGAYPFMLKPALDVDRLANPSAKGALGRMLRVAGKAGKYALPLAAVGGLAGAVFTPWLASHAKKNRER